MLCKICEVVSSERKDSSTHYLPHCSWSVLAASNHRLNGINSSTIIIWGNILVPFVICFKSHETCLLFGKWLINSCLLSNWFPSIGIRANFKVLRLLHWVIPFLLIFGLSRMGSNPFFRNFFEIKYMNVFLMSYVFHKDFVPISRVFWTIFFSTKWPTITVFWKLFCSKMVFYDRTILGSWVDLMSWVSWKWNEEQKPSKIGENIQWPELAVSHGLWIGSWMGLGAVFGWRRWEKWWVVLH